MIALFLWACVPKPVAPPEPVVEPEPTRADGPIAGPRAIVEHPQPERPAEIPGGGPMNPYVVQVRKAVGDTLLSCIESDGMALVTDAALVTATIAGDGSLVSVSIDRSSGSEAYDACVLKSFRDTKIPIPPDVLVGDRGSVTTPQMAFR